MNCPKCGSEVATGFQFCMNCGFSLVREEPAEKQDEFEKKPVSGNGPEPAAEQGYVPRRRRAAQAPAPEEEKEAPAPVRPPVRISEPAPEPEPLSARDPDPARTMPPAPPAPAQPVREAPPARYETPPRKKPERTAPPRTGRKYKRSSGKGVLFWLGILVLVLAAVYIGACILMPENPLTAPAVNLAMTVWNYFAACGNAVLWFPIALGAIIVLAILKATVGKSLRRKIHASDLAEAQEIARRVVVAETLAPPHQIHAEIEQNLNSHRTRKQYFPKGKLELDEFSGSGVPLDYTCGADHFTANFVFQRMDRSGTRVFLEIIEWQMINGVVSGRCLQAMRGLEPMLRDTVLDIDTGARFQVYDR